MFFVILVVVLVGIGICIAIIHWPSPQPPLLSSNNLILTPQYRRGKCYVTNETVLTFLSGDNQTQVIQNNYTCIFVVYDTNTQVYRFTSVCQKVSEQLFNENRTAIGEPENFNPS